MSEIISIAKLADCMDFMAEFPDKFFDLAVVDPPYGGGDIAQVTPRKKKTNLKSTKRIIHKQTEWNVIPSDSYFLELFRVSKNQIIWGANYYANKLPNSRGWIFWDKRYENTYNFSAGELCWTSFDIILKKVNAEHRWLPHQQLHIHPTQKPVALYKWLLTNYAKQGDKILDTHLGSGSSRIAAYDLGFDFWSCELDKDYFEAQEQRFKEHIKQPNMLASLEVKPMKQVGLFGGE